MARGWDTQEKARAEIERLTGWRIPQSVYAEWESGRRVPSDANLARLQEFYGSPEPSQATESGDSVLAAVRLLVDEIRAERAARVEWERGLLSALQELATGRAPQGDPEHKPPVNAGR